MTTGFTDRYGLPVSTTSAEAVERYVEGVDHMLGLESGAEECFDAAIAADQGFALAHAGRALYLFQRLQMVAAKASAVQAQELSASLSQHERQHIEVVMAVVDGAAERAGRLIREHLTGFPGDALLLRQLIQMLALGGMADGKQQMAALLDSVAAAYGDDWFFLATRAMRLQDEYRFEEARRDAERALASRPSAASAAHPVAHVFFETADHPGGVAFLEEWLTGYDPAAPYFSHLSWHQALAELAQGRYARAMDLFERNIRPAIVPGSIAPADAISLLWRCEVYGAVGAPLPWAALQAAIDAIPGRPGITFRDAHLALLYAATGDDAALDRLTDGLRDLEAKGHPTAGAVVLPLVRGVAAFARRDYGEAIDCIEPIAGRVVGIGGSNAQREVFEDTLVEAYLRAGRYDAAEALLRVRLGRRPSARDYFWLGRAQAGSGRVAEARGQFEQATSRWSGADPDSRELAALHHARELVSA